MNIARRLSAMLLLCIAGTAFAQQDPAPSPPPLIREIAFEGNETTQPKVMLREILIAVGEPADPDRIERSRQAILDLRLFRSVEVRQEPVADGVRVVFVVREKWYLLPLPRLGYDSDHHLSYGGQLLWSNVAGLNQTARVNLVRSGSGDNTERSLSGSYDIPFFDGSQWSMNLSAGHDHGPQTYPVAYDETTDNAQVILSKGLSGPPLSQGWRAGGGVLWLNESASGIGAPESNGYATALVGVASYRDLRYLVYSEVGTTFDFRTEIASREVLSDYSYEMLKADWRRYTQIGATPYQSLNYAISGGARFEGPNHGSAFALGGRSTLRAYSSDFLEGNAYYRFAVEYLHPLGWDWLRGLVVLEAANAMDRANDIEFNRVRTSLGLGVRLRVTWLVNFEVEAGAAVPLDRRGSPRFFGGKN
jgi:outer membrane protein assembly factor BamA